MNGVYLFSEFKPCLGIQVRTMSLMDSLFQNNKLQIICELQNKEVYVKLINNHFERLNSDLQLGN
jgi:hypothetical protein